MQNYVIKKILTSLTRRGLFAVLICIGMVQIAAYYLAGMTVRGDGALAIAQPDTLLYCQAARRIVEGAPFMFSAGALPSTGTTSVLYPFILAVLYFLGAQGDALLLAGFLLNAVFYLLFLCGWGLILSEWFRHRPLSRIFAIILLGCFGPTAFCALAQSDVGLWMAVSAFLSFGLYTGRKGIWIPLLILGPWIRPEGMVFVVAVFICWIISAGRRKCHLGGWSVILGLFLAAMSMLGVFVLNFALTGHVQFSSVAHKGYFTLYPWPQALMAVASDSLSVLKGYLLGLPTSMPRDGMFVPLLGALTLWSGILGRGWRKSFRLGEGVIYLAALGSLATVCTSGWQDKNLDRYLAWCWPVPLLFIAEGCWVLRRQFRRFRAWTLLPTVHVLFTVVLAVVFAGIFHVVSDRSDRIRAFARQCEHTMTLRTPIGIWSNSGVAYEFSSRRVAHLCGVYSPEFFTVTPVAALEVLKHDKESRFWYYFFDHTDDPGVWGGAEDILLPEQLLVGPDGFELRKANWSALDEAERTPVAPHPGLSLCDRVDVGYEKDESEHHYDFLNLYHMPIFEPFTKVGRLNGRKVVDGGRVVMGGDEMTIKAKPGKDVYVVMRTAAAQQVFYARTLVRNSFSFSFKSPMELHLEVDEKEVGHATFALSTNELSDVVFKIPGTSITTDTPRLSFHGDHLVCGYWFYQ